MYIYTRTYVYICAHVHMYTRVHIHVEIYIHIHVYKHMHGKIYEKSPLIYDMTHTLQRVCGQFQFLAPRDSCI